MTEDTWVIVKKRGSKIPINKSIEYLLFNYDQYEILSYTKSGKLKYTKILGIRQHENDGIIVDLNFVGSDYILDSTHMIMTTYGYRLIPEVKGYIIKSVYGNISVNNIRRVYNTDIRTYDVIVSDRSGICLSNGSIIL